LIFAISGGLGTLFNYKFYVCLSNPIPRVS